MGRVKTAIEEKGLAHKPYRIVPHDGGFTARFLVAGDEDEAIIKENGFLSERV